eukprot:3633141-Rhodomonas_salina.2
MKYRLRSTCSSSGFSMHSFCSEPKRWQATGLVTSVAKSDTPPSSNNLPCRARRNQTLGV